jgi:Icc-related predicted phosphoesterase
LESSNNQEVDFLDAPLAFERVHKKAVLMKGTENFMKLGNMKVPEKVVDAHVVQITVEFMKHISEHFFHGSLSQIWGLVETHGQAKAKIFAKDGNEDAEPTALVLKNEALVLHTKINLG